MHTYVHIDVNIFNHLRIKVFEGVLGWKIAGFLEGLNLLNPNHHSFRCNRECLTQLLHHIHDTIETLRSVWNSDAIYLDFSKAYGCVGHNILQSKLTNVGIYRKRNISRRTENNMLYSVKSTEVTKCHKWCPPGDCIRSASFYSLYKRSFQRHNTLQCENICWIFQTPENYQWRNAVSQWAVKNKMQVNQGKFELIYFRRKSRLKQPFSLPSWVTTYSI